MKLAVIAITKNGTECAGNICTKIEADLFIKKKFVTDNLLINSKGKSFFIEDEFSKVVEMLFTAYEGIIFVMATGIVVRSIAYHIKDKMTDPAVVVVDERGLFSISLLSGHIGGANLLAQMVGDVIGAIPVITTATDINGVTAFDELAVRNDCAIENIKDLKFISSALVNRESITFFSDLKTKGKLKGNINYEGNNDRYAVIISSIEKSDIQAKKVLYLRPKNLVLGIGCKKGKTFADIEKAVLDFLKKSNRSILSVRSIASISLKKDEQGIIEFCSRFGIPFVTFEPEQLKAVEHLFDCSDFVRGVTGVGNVCESSAFYESLHGRIICKKTIYDGITLALAEEDKEILL